MLVFKSVLIFEEGVDENICYFVVVVVLTSGAIHLSESMKYRDFLCREGLYNYSDFMSSEFAEIKNSCRVTSWQFHLPTIYNLQEYFSFSETERCVYTAACKRSSVMVHPITSRSLQNCAPSHIPFTEVSFEKLFNAAWKWRRKLDDGG